MEIRPLEAADLEQAWELDRECFHVPAAGRDHYLRWHPPEELLGAFDAGRLVGMAGTRPHGQRFGGRAVPLGAVYSVAVAPEARGRGLARSLLVQSLARMAAAGQAISTLYPATTKLYRGVGYELGGCHVWRAVAPPLLSALPQPGDGRVRALPPERLSLCDDCYRRIARTTNGFLDRQTSHWQARAEFWSDRSIFVAEDTAGAIQGYLVYRQIDGPASAVGGAFRLVVEEMLLASRDAALALLRLLGSWAPQVDRIFFRGPAEEPLLLLLPEQQIETVGEVRWMTRVVDPAAAVAARGFPEGLVAEVHLGVEDPVLGKGEERFVLRVAAGRGALEPGGTGALRLDVGAFSSLFTGWASTATLARAGRLEGGDASGRAALDAAFTGPTPWMPEQF
jgi:predicted acetyltransferase